MYMQVDLQIILLTKIVFQKFMSRFLLKSQTAKIQKLQFNKF